MLLAELVDASDRVAATPRRTQKVEILAECLERLSGDEIDAGTGFLAGAARQGRIGIGWARVREAFDEPAAKTPSLTIAEVDRAFAELVEVSGKGATKRRSELLRALLAAATAPEQSFLGRLLLGELRQGALESVLLEAIAKASNVPPAAVRRAQMVAADLGAVARAARFEGEAGLDRFRLTLFSPVQPMLASTAANVEEALARFSPAAFELKLDGARIQVHKRGDEVRAYSRRLNEVTERIPELIDAARALPAEELILDGEAIAIGPEGRSLPFQVTMRRFGRRLDVEAMQREIPLSSFFFDCLHVDGKTLIGEPYAQRFEALAASVPNEMLIHRIVTADPSVAAAFLGAVVDRGEEGVMAKALDAPYEAGSRGASWLKLKAVRTLDLLVIAAEWGSGRREGWLSNLHLAAKDDQGGAPIMLGKTFKGMTDQMLAWQTERLLELETHREGHIVRVRPELVVEIAIGDVQASRQYPGGVALRFARVKRYREDKRPEEADTIATVRALLPAGHNR